MNESPGAHARARARVGLTGLTVAEHFRHAEGQDVLLSIDNIFHFTQGLDNHGFQAFEFDDLDNLKGSTKAASKEFEKIDQLFNVYADKSSGTIE